MVRAQKSCRESNTVPEICGCRLFQQFPRAASLVTFPKPVINSFFLFLGRSGRGSSHRTSEWRQVERSYGQTLSFVVETRGVISVFDQVASLFGGTAAAVWGRTLDITPLSRTCCVLSVVFRAFKAKVQTRVATCLVLGRAVWFWSITSVYQRSRSHHTMLRHFTSIITLSSIYYYLS